MNRITARTGINIAYIKEIGLLNEVDLEKVKRILQIAINKLADYEDKEENEIDK